MVNFRILELADYDAVYQLWTSMDGIGLRSLDDSREGFARYIQRNPRTSFLAEADGQAVGVILAGHDGRRGFIHHTAVLPAWQGQGIGKALMRHAEAALRAEGIHKAVMVVFEHNQQGNEFWESQGWTTRPDLVYRNKSLNDANY